MGERKIYILLSDTGTLFTRMIKLYTKKPYNHASISFNADFTRVYSFGRKQPNNPFIGGFVKENIRDGLFTHARGAIYSYTATDEQIKNMLNYIKEIEAEKHLYRYNLLGLFFLTFNKKINRKNAFFCSEFVATVLNKGNVVQFDKAISFVTPHDFQEIDDFHLEYQGDLADLFHVENHLFFPVPTAHR